MCPIIKITVLALIGTGMATGAEPLPVSAFTQGPKIYGPAISPDGRYLSALAEIDGKDVVMVLDVQQRSPFEVVMTSEPGANVALSWCEWGNPTRLVCGLRGTVGGVTRASKLVAIDADGKNVKELNAVYSSDKVVDWTNNDPQTILVEGRRGIGALNIYNGKYHDMTNELLNYVMAGDKIKNFFSDGEGRFPLGYARHKDKGDYFARINGEQKWRLLKQLPPNAVFEFDLEPLRVASANNIAYAIGVHDDRNALWTIDLTDQRPPQVLFSHPKSDVFGPVMVGNDFLGVRYYTDRPRVHYVDPTIAAKMDVVDRTLVGTTNQIQSWTRDRKTWVVRATSDIDATSYYLYSTDSSKLVVLGKQYPALDASKLGRTRIVELPAQDGTIVSALLTEPPGSDSAHRPLIVVVRSVDEAPAVGSYDSVVQFLSSRGYAVLRVNSRGLLGYGRAWIKAARYDWSGLPYTDALDGARWAAASGLADPKRICIMGEGWGGYTALLGAVRNSDVFKCAAAIDSTGDLSLEPSWVQNSESTDPHSQAQIGLDTKTLRKDAPRWNADRVNIPILLVRYTVRGNEDEEMRAMAKALRSEKKPHTEVEIKIANSRSTTATERAQLLDALERYFAAHLGS